MTYHRTPGTRLWWQGVGGWVEAAGILKQRRLSEARSRALAAHGAHLPRSVIEAATDVDALDVALRLLTRGPAGLCRPHRGARGVAPQTRIIMDLKNRRARLIAERDVIPKGPNWKAVHG